MVSKAEALGAAKDMAVRLCRMRMFWLVQAVIVLLCAVQAALTQNIFKLLGMGVVLVALSAVPVAAAAVIRLFYDNNATTASIPRRSVSELEPAAGGGAESPAAAGDGPEAVEPAASVPETGTADPDRTAASS